MHFTSSTGIVSNNIVADCSFALITWDTSSSVMVDYNDFWNNTINASPGPNGMQQDPLFVDLAQGNLHLRRGSPCIDRATSVGTPRTDFEGDPRPQWFGVDIGADESPYNGRIPPTGSITINGGAAYTSSTATNLTLSATDDSSIVASMRFSNDRTNWTSWQNYSTSKTWTLPPGDGLKTVYVQFKDDADNVSTSSDTITLDIISPTGSITVASGAAYTTSPAVILSLAATDGGSGVSQMRLSNDGASWTTWEACASSRTWTLPVPASESRLRLDAGKRG